MEEYMKNEEKLAKDQTIIEEDVKDDADVIGMPSTLNLSQAMTLFQQKNIQAVKDKNNPFFKSTYADLTSIINAVNHGS